MGELFPQYNTSCLELFRVLFMNVDNIHTFYQIRATCKVAQVQSLLNSGNEYLLIRKSILSLKWIRNHDCRYDALHAFTQSIMEIPVKFRIADELVSSRWVNPIWAAECCIMTGNTVMSLHFINMLNSHSNVKRLFQAAIWKENTEIIKRLSSFEHKVSLYLPTTIIYHPKVSSLVERIMAPKFSTMTTEDDCHLAPSACCIMKMKNVTDCLNSLIYVESANDIFCVVASGNEFLTMEIFKKGIDPELFSAGLAGWIYCYPTLDTNRINEKFDAFLSDWRTSEHFEIASVVALVARGDSISLSQLRNVSIHIWEKLINSTLLIHALSYHDNSDVIDIFNLLPCKPLIGHDPDDIEFHCAVRNCVNRCLRTGKFNMVRKILSTIRTNLTIPLSATYVAPITSKDVIQLMNAEETLFAPIYESCLFRGDLEIIRSTLWPLKNPNVSIILIELFPLTLRASVDEVVVILEESEFFSDYQVHPRLASDVILLKLQGRDELTTQLYDSNRELFMKNALLLGHRKVLKFFYNEYSSKNLYLGNLFEEAQYKNILLRKWPDCAKVFIEPP